MKKLVLLPVLIAAFATTSLVAQNYTVSSESSMVIKGTSNLHDWETSVTQINGSATFNNEEGLEIEKAQLTIPVNMIKSEKGKKMDNLTYDALDADAYPKIEFKLVSAEVTEVAGKQEAMVNGVITVKGQSKPVKFTAVSSDSAGMIWKGSVDMKMTDFGVDPPTALLGTLKTRDEITVEFNIKFK